MKRQVSSGLRDLPALRSWCGNANVDTSAAFTSTSPSVYGTYEPFTGDFDGDGIDDIFWYAPGTAADTIWWNTTTRASFAASKLIPNPNIPSWTYSYDADDLRTTKTSNANDTIDFTWDRSGGLPLLLAQHDNAGTTYLIYGPDGQPIEQINPGNTVTWYHHDQLGSTRQTTNNAGTTTGTSTYRPYGAPAGTTAPPASSTPVLGYAGQYTDPETGYQYLRARYYDSKTAQFLNRDPLVRITGQPYAYAGNNPLNYTDPLGLVPWDAVTDLVGDRVDDVVDAGRSVGNFVYENAGTLSTVASFAATGAYAFCAVSAGVGCGVGLALSATSTVSVV